MKTSKILSLLLSFTVALIVFPAFGGIAALAAPLQADLALTKTVSDPTPNLGDYITYTVTLRDGRHNAAAGFPGADGRR